MANGILNPFNVMYGSLFGNEEQKKKTTKPKTEQEKLASKQKERRSMLIDNIYNKIQPQQSNTLSQSQNLLNSVLQNKNANVDSNFSFNGNADPNNLGNLDVATELPKLNTRQISAIIQKHFPNSVLNDNDAQNIFNAQQQTGMSALAILGIGALESGWGTSAIAKAKGNLWGYGAVNSNPMGGAKDFRQNGALGFAQAYMKDYYNGYGSHSINSTGTGNNPSGKGYAYNDNGSISTSWAPNVSSIMGKLYNTAKGVQ